MKKIPISLFIIFLTFSANASTYDSSPRGFWGILGYGLAFGIFSVIYSKIKKNKNK